MLPQTQQEAETHSGFEIFKPPRSPHIVLTKSGQLVLNIGAFELLGKPRHVLYLFDREKRLAAIRVTNAEDPDAYKITRSTAGTGLSSFVGFAREHKIAPGRYPAEMSADGLIFEVGSAYE